MIQEVVPTTQRGYAAPQLHGMIANDMTSTLPFDDFRNLLANLPAADTTAEARVRTLFAKADKPRNSLGRIEDIAAWLAGREPTLGSLRASAAADGVDLPGSPAVAVGNPLAQVADCAPKSFARWHFAAILPGGTAMCCHLAGTPGQLRALRVPAGSS